MKAGLQKYVLNVLAAPVNPLVHTLSVSFASYKLFLHSPSISINFYASSVGPVVKLNGGINSSRFIPVSVEYKATSCRWDSRLGDYIMAVVSPGSLT
jgi:hypothetical protein